MIAAAYRIYREHVANNLDEGEIDDLFIGRFDDTEYHEFLWDTIRDYYSLSMSRPLYLDKHLPSIGSYIDIDKFRHDYEIDKDVVEEDGWHHGICSMVHRKIYVFDKQ